MGIKKDASASISAHLRPDAARHRRRRQGYRRSDHHHGGECVPGWKERRSPGPTGRQPEAEEGVRVAGCRLAPAPSGQLARFDSSTILVLAGSIPELPAAQGGHRSPTTVALHRIHSGGPLVAAFIPAGSSFWLTPSSLERVVV